MLVVLVLQIPSHLGLHRSCHSVIRNLSWLLIQIHLAVPVRWQAASVSAMEGLLLGWHLMSRSLSTLHLLHGVRCLRCWLLPGVNLILELISGTGRCRIRIILQRRRCRRRPDHLRRG